MSGDISTELRERAAWRAENEGPFTKENLVEWRAADHIASLEAEREDARRQRDEIGRAWDEADARAKEAEARAASLEKALAEARKDVGLLLQDAANKGEEPDILMLELNQERARADRAEEAFAICKQELDKTRKALILTPMAERVAELPEFMTALSEWGCEDPNEQAKSITEFLNSLIGLREYLSLSKQKDGE